MHILFSHRLFPAQFGQIARHLSRLEGFQCSFVCEQLAQSAPGGGPLQFYPDFPAGVEMGTNAPVAIAKQIFRCDSVPPGPTEPLAEHHIEGIRRIQYPPGSGDGTFESHLARALLIYQTLKAHPDLKPDLVVGPCLYASALVLPEVCACPVINYLDYYYRPDDSFLHFRPEFPPTEADVVRARAHNALALHDLHSCTAAYSPTQWQRRLYPEAYQAKIETIFDGIDQTFWYRRQVPRRIGNRPAFPPETRVVTYVARGLEALRGFDIFMKVAGRICAARPDVVFVVVGSEHFYHGLDRNYIRAASFRDHVFAQGSYDLSRFIFTGRIPSTQLVDILSLSDLHIYLTAPFVLSWSLFNALACGCTVLASDTTPVREVIRHEVNGLLADFFDVDGLTRQALRVLDAPAQFAPLGRAGVQTIEERYSLAQAIPQLVDFYRRVARGGAGSSGA
jgi:glycosyltransferase involved in cell wall biosynthesis